MYDRSMPYARKQEQPQVINPYTQEIYKQLCLMSDSNVGVLDNIKNLVNLMSNISLQIEKIIPKEPVRSSLIVSNFNPISIDRKGFRHYYIMSPVPLSLSVGRGTSAGMINLNPNEWTLISFADSTQLFGPGSSINDIYYVCSDEVVP